MKVLIVYGTTEGQTRKICEFCKAELEAQKHIVTLYDATNHPVMPEGFDAVIIAASMHMEKYQSSIKNYILKYKYELNETHSAFISVSLTAASDDETSWTELRSITDHFLHGMGWKPALVEYTAGALLFTEYDFFKKFIMRQITRKATGQPVNGSDVEYTDWTKLKLFLKNFRDLWVSKPQTVRNEETDHEAVC